MRSETIMCEQLKDVRKKQAYDSYLEKGHMTLCQVSKIYI